MEPANKLSMPKIKYSICPKGSDHEDETLSLVCMNKLCLNNALGCNICVDQDHHDHRDKTISLRGFISKVYNDFNSK